tara:strand:- start:280 stop:813 length:534 start_codon:yes stop_codon:yes gene_type:complete
MKPVARRVLIGLLTGILLHFIAAQVNHYLAPWQLHVWVGGLVVALPALRLSYRGGFWIVALTGLLFDATTPVPFGLHALLFAIAHLLVYRVRARLASEENLIGVLVALLLNLGLFIVFAFTRFTVTPDVGSAGLRLFSDLIVSQLFLALIAPWFFALQVRSLEISGAGLRDDPTVMI